jgi:hypothetical protein
MLFITGWLMGTVEVCIGIIMLDKPVEEYAGKKRLQKAISCQPMKA